VNVVPAAGVRQLPVPQVSGRETRPEAEFVSKVMTVKNVPATQLVPLLRPIMPQVGHLVALPCVNKLFIVDTFGNVQRIQAIIEALDVGEPYTPEKCSSRESWVAPGGANLPTTPRETTVEHR
jgi:general secretion pathway protein D